MNGAFPGRAIRGSDVYNIISIPCKATFFISLSRCINTIHTSIMCPFLYGKKYTGQNAQQLYTRTGGQTRGLYMRTHRNMRNLFPDVGTHAIFTFFFKARCQFLSH